jgi:predicted transposase YdaD
LTSSLDILRNKGLVVATSYIHLYLVTKEISSERSDELMTIAERLREEGREEVAKNLLKMNLNLKEVEKATGLSKEKILEIKKKSVN